MTLNRNGQFAKYVYGNNVPDISDLCSIFWRTLGKTALLGLLGAFLGIVLALTIVDPLGSVIVLSVLASIVTVVGVCAATTEHVETRLRALKRGEAPEAWWEAAYQFAKGNYCPRVTFKE